MKVDIFNQKGKKTANTIDLADAVFAANVNDNVLAQYVYVYLSNQRAPIAHAKDRSEVSGGGRKPWKQKGTGRARTGSNRSPIWTGGGATFGPTNARNWKKSLPKKMRKVAFKGAFSSMLADGNVTVIDKIEFADSKLTQQAHELLKGFESPKKAVIVAADKDETLLNAFSNIPSVRIVRAGELNAYDVLTAGKVFLLADAAEYFNKQA